MKVLLVAHHLPPRHVAGTEIYTARLASELGRRHDVLVFSTDDDPLLRPGSLARRSGDGFGIVELAEPRATRSPEDTWRSPRAETAFASVLGDFAPDVVHFNHLRFMSFAFPRIARDQNVATIMTLHEYWLICAREGQLLYEGRDLCSGPEPRKCADCLKNYRFGLTRAEALAARVLARVRRGVGLDLRTSARQAALAMRTLARKLKPGEALGQDRPSGTLEVVEARNRALHAMEDAVQTFIAPSKFLAAVFKASGLFRKEPDILPYGVKLPTARHERRVDGRLRIGFLGTVTPHKGVHVLVDAVSTLPGDTYQLSVFGRDDLRPEYVEPMKARAASLPVRFHGSFHPDAAPALLAEIDVLVVPSVWVENQPFVILEAFAAGVPVVASALGGMKELVQDGVNGRLFEPGDSADLAGVLRSLADRAALEALRAGIVTPTSLEEHVRALETRYLEAIAAIEPA